MTRLDGGTVVTLALRTGIVAAAWLILTDADLRSPLLAGAAVITTGVASLWLVPPRQSGLRWRGLARFVPFFLVTSALGGLDVARRALDPRRTVAPELIEYGLQLPPGAPRGVFTALVSLLPGTLSAELEGDRLTIHVLDARMPVRRTLSRLESHVAALYGLELAD
jgi:multicomponent Na+:H+ antiporter subunit E